MVVDGRTLLEQQGWSLGKLTQQVSDNLGVSEAALLSMVRFNDLSVAKSLICYWRTKEIGLSCREIADSLDISQQAVSNRVPKGKAYCER